MELKKKQVPEYITEKEAMAIISKCPKERDKLILRTMWETGGRISEVLCLVPDHIDILNKCISLPNLKQEQLKLKDVFLFSESILCQDLMEFADRNGIGGRDWIFQGGSQRTGKIGQVSPTYIWYLLCASRERGDSSSSKWRRKEGLSTSLNIRKKKGEDKNPAWPHLFRHGAAMNIYHRTQRLDAVQHQLGHSTIQTTEVYAGMTDEERKNIIQKS